MERETRIELATNSLEGWTSVASTSTYQLLTPLRIAAKTARIAAITLIGM